MFMATVTWYAPARAWKHTNNSADSEIQNSADTELRSLRMKITEALFAEHLLFHNMFDQLEVMIPALKTLPEIKALALLMESLLRAHSKTEDDLFMGPLEHCFEQIGQRESFHEEHVEIDDNLKMV